MSKKKRLGIVIAIILILYIVPGFNASLETTYYTLESDRVESPVRLAVVADLHSCDYGEEAEALMNAIHKVEPDAVVMVGDILDDRMPIKYGNIFLQAVSGSYPCYYVSGNHEYWSGEISGLKALIRSYGIKVLEGDSDILTIADTAIAISGIDDVDGGMDRWRKQLDGLIERDQPYYHVLLTHRPHLAAHYDTGDFDLILAGHVHGGQWQFPGFTKGVVGPDQGLFPKYSDGLYELEQSKMIISRGLARESTRIFRFYNRPELVVVDIE